MDERVRLRQGTGRRPEAKGPRAVGEQMPLGVEIDYQ